MFSTIIVKDLDERQNISMPIFLVFPINIGKSDIVLSVFVTIVMIAHTFLIRQAILKNKADGRRNQYKNTMPPTAKIKKRNPGRWPNSFLYLPMSAQLSCCSFGWMRS
ncbi:hypothetical protein [Paenibacillus sp. P22]|uniref:hypothetical protein n=1 Tax=Paenibacillus TaxID=44249 RepID=UPI000434ED74|nr:hypothetical protein [Paenibacillus sp. P22]KKC47676.1 hypothetical protein VE23_12070 [Paenibacillus sp. D9]CDN44120.1 hypothetical protein BN871_EF_00030 [Paenibacillus sp. P22]